MTPEPRQMELFRLPPPRGVAPDRRLLLNGRLIAYSLRRDRRRLSLRIDERGLGVGAPRNMPLQQIEAFIREHAEWVKEKLDAAAQASAKRRLLIHEGALLPVLGATVRVRLVAGGGCGYWRQDELWLAARPGADLTALAQRALQRRMREYAQPQLLAAAQQLGRPPPPLQLTSARTRWGSCSAAGVIRLNWRLVHLAPQLVDYVIAHEAAHLLEMNHGPRFWKLVEELCPQWRAARQQLKGEAAQTPLL